MKKTFGEMTEREIEKFSDDFYAIWESEFPEVTTDRDLPVDQWGRPSDWCPQREIVTPQDWWDENRAEIADLIADDRSAKIEAFCEAAHKTYTCGRSDEDLDGYDQEMWADGMTGDEFESIEDAKKCGEDAAWEKIREKE